MLLNKRNPKSALAETLQGMNSQTKFGKETMDSRGTQEAKIGSIFGTQAGSGHA
jgi:hypothetical protein